MQSKITPRPTENGQPKISVLKSPPSRNRHKSSGRLPTRSNRAFELRVVASKKPNAHITQSQYFAPIPSPRPKSHNSTFRRVLFDENRPSASNLFESSDCPLQRTLSRPQTNLSKYTTDKRCILSASIQQNIPLIPPIFMAPHSAATEALPVRSHVQEAQERPSTSYQKAPPVVVKVTRIGCNGEFFDLGSADQNETKKITDKKDTTFDAHQDIPTSGCLLKQISPERFSPHSKIGNPLGDDVSGPLKVTETKSYPMPEIEDRRKSILRTKHSSELTKDKMVDVDLADYSPDTSTSSSSVEEAVEGCSPQPTEPSMLTPRVGEKIRPVLRPTLNQRESEKAVVCGQKQTDKSPYPVASNTLPRLRPSHDIVQAFLRCIRANRADETIMSTLSYSTAKKENSATGRRAESAEPCRTSSQFTVTSSDVNELVIPVTRPKNLLKYPLVRLHLRAHCMGGRQRWRNFRQRWISKMNKRIYLIQKQQRDEVRLAKDKFDRIQYTISKLAKQVDGMVETVSEQGKMMKHLQKSAELQRSLLQKIDEQTSKPPEDIKRRKFFDTTDIFTVGDREYSFHSQLDDHGLSDEAGRISEKWQHSENDRRPNSVSASDRLQRQPTTPVEQLTSPDDFTDRPLQKSLLSPPTRRTRIRLMGCNNSTSEVNTSYFGEKLSYSGHVVPYSEVDGMQEPEEQVTTHSNVVCSGHSAHSVVQSASGEDVVVIQSERDNPKNYYRYAYTGQSEQNLSGFCRPGVTRCVHTQTDQRGSEKRVVKLVASEFVPCKLTPLCLPLKGSGTSMTGEAVNPCLSGNTTVSSENHTTYCNIECRNVQNAQKTQFSKLSRTCVSHAAEHLAPPKRSPVSCEGDGVNCKLEKTARNLNASLGSNATYITKLFQKSPSRQLMENKVTFKTMNKVEGEIEVPVEHSCLRHILRFAPSSECSTQADDRSRITVGRRHAHRPRHYRSQHLDVDESNEFSYDLAETSHHGMITFERNNNSCLSDGTDQVTKSKQDKIDLGEIPFSELKKQKCPELHFVTNSTAKTKMAPLLLDTGSKVSDYALPEPKEVRKESVVGERLAASREQRRINTEKELAEEMRRLVQVKKEAGLKRKQEIIEENHQQSGDDGGEDIGMSESKADNTSNVEETSNTVEEKKPEPDVPDYKERRRQRLEEKTRKEMELILAMTEQAAMERKMRSKSTAVPKEGLKETINVVQPLQTDFSIGKHHTEDCEDKIASPVNSTVEAINPVYSNVGDTDGMDSLFKQHEPPTPMIDAHTSCRTQESEGSALPSKSPSIFIQSDKPVSSEIAVCDSSTQAHSGIPSWMYGDPWSQSVNYFNPQYYPPSAYPSYVMYSSRCHRAGSPSLASDSLDTCSSNTTSKDDYEYSYDSSSSTSSWSSSEVSPESYNRTSAASWSPTVAECYVDRTAPTYDFLYPTKPVRPDSVEFTPRLYRANSLVEFSNARIPSFQCPILSSNRVRKSVHFTTPYCE
ncbi:unnamed protein product [Calicophoron daubneyi]|uniref:Uncharacterized protein n=1 Tax=Calicophoron daubneyi TaxID=300641 RepID=A0AAV2T9W8_CALDB